MPSAPSRLVGRDDVVGALRSRAAASGPSLVTVRGVAGSGRTALLDTLAAGHDGPVRRARGAAWETGRDHGVLAQLLGGSADAADAFTAARRLVDALAPDAATLVLVDDAHVADVASLQALDTAVAHHPGARMLVVLTAPPDEELPSRSPLQVRLGGLTAPQVAELAAASGRALGDLAAERLRRHTAGIPRHVLALLDEVPDEQWADPYVRLPAPAAVATGVRRRLDACSRPAAAVSEAVAVLGVPAELHEVGSVAGLDDVFTPLDEAARAGLVSRAGGRHGPMATPPDPMVRAAVLDHVGPARAAEVRLRAADVVADPVRALRYRAAATPGHDDELAGRLDTEAAREAADGAWSAVAALLLDAARLTPDTGLRETRLVRAVDALVGAGEVRDASAMLPAVEATPETPLRGAVLGYLAVNLGHAADAQSRLDRAWELVDARSDPATAALIATRHVLHALARGHGDDLVTWADRVVELAAPGSPPAVEAAAVRPLGLAASGQVAEAAQEYRDVAATIAHGPQNQRVTMGRGWLDVLDDDVDEARFALESAVPNGPLGGSSRISLWALGWLARARFLCGEWQLALSVVDQGRALSARTGIVLAIPLLEWTAAQVHAMRGDRDRAEEAMLRSEVGPLDYEIMRVPSLLARAQVAEIGADHARVVRKLEPLTRAAPGGTASEPGWWPWADAYANALVMLGDVDEANAFLRPHEERAAARGHRSTMARLGYARGRWHGAAGDVDAARATFETALGHLDGLPLRYDRARIGLAFGQTLRRAGRRREADPVLLEAREQFDALGAVVHVARCDRELRAGTREEHDDRHGRAGPELTPQETAVTDLVAGGMTNREVAAELHVTVKTVQYHLTRIYTKLGVRGRAELAAHRNRG